MHTETLSIKVSKAEKNRLRRVASERRSTPSRLLRDALRLVLEGEAGGSLLEKHRHLFGGLDAGPGDLSTNPRRMEGFGR